MTACSGGGNSCAVFGSRMTMAPASAAPVTRPVAGVEAVAGAGAGAVVADVVDGVDSEQPVNAARTVAAAVSVPSLPSLTKRIFVSSFMAAVLAASAVSAQQIWVGRGRFWRTPPKWAKP